MGTYSIHVPCRLLALATPLSPPSIRPQPWSAYRTLQQTSHPDPVNCSNIKHYSMRATAHVAHSSQQSPSSTYTDVHAENELQSVGHNGFHLSAVSQHPPTKKDLGTCASALPTSASKPTPHTRLLLQVPLLSNSSTWGAQTDSNSRCYFTLEKCG